MQTPEQGAPPSGPVNQNKGDARAVPDQGAESSVAAIASQPAAGAVSGGASGNAQARRSGVLPLVLALVALVGVGALGWQVYESRLADKEIRQEVARRLAAGDGTVAELRALARQQQETIAALQSRFGALESQVAETEGQAVALEALYQEYSRSRSDRLLAEVEQAINIAAQQLQLAGNMEAALIALQGAEARLAAPEQGHLQPLRRALIEDIDQIKAHPQVDVSGLALRLEILLERVDQLPLAFEVALAEAAAAHEKAMAVEEAAGDDMFARALNFAKALGVDVWNEVRGMVRLERLDRADPVLLAPAQSTYLRENVKIRLLTARLALLARDGRTYVADLAQARGWIERFFDLQDDQVKRAIADMQELEQVPIKVEAPTLRATFAALRMVQARVPGGGRVPAPASGAAPAADGTR
ncbi:MAG: uroporphyrinogen-III C-methyltransferase [Rhodocyclales bacterium]|nr:uroporphyrinogen-III C-methyltransferase [Rhodocyclales bacterium]